MESEENACKMMSEKLDHVHLTENECKFIEILAFLCVSTDILITKQ